jgi:hypothetical protein
VKPTHALLGSSDAAKADAPWSEALPHEARTRKPRQALPMRATRGIGEQSTPEHRRRGERSGSEGCIGIEREVGDAALPERRSSGCGLAMPDPVFSRLRITEVVMEDGQWGHCRTCRYFGSPARVPLDSEEARCAHAELERFALTVFGANGCKGWELRPGLSEQAEHQPGA